MLNFTSLYKEISWQEFDCVQLLLYVCTLQQSIKGHLKVNKPVSKETFIEGCRETFEGKVIN